jgi:asparagine synthase (glutamine-hydrolysing)
MCGICGVVAAKGRADPDPSFVDLATEAIRHRGPDHGATVALGPCSLGYRRLRVIDLATGDQPVRNERGDVVVVFNGEIYNYRALRAELESQGHDLAGRGDTPALPHLYEQHGDRFVERLDGMFALAVWDEPRRRLLLARDRFGKKPLLWTRLADGTVAFASELKALLAFPGVGRSVDLERLDAYLALGYVPGDRTALQGVNRLPPGCTLVVEDGVATVSRYWQLEARPRQLHDEEWIAEVREGVLAAVRKRLVADVPLGALLSGGIDSSVVVAAMAQESAEPVRTFSIGFPEARYDERPYARAVAERFGTIHEELLVEPDAAALLPRLADAYDEPFGDPSALPTFLVCEHARRFVTVALVGDGGDEVFGGYERYRAHALAARFDRLPGTGTAASAAARGLRLLRASRTEPRSAPFRAARFLDTMGLDPTERYGQLMQVFPLELRRSLWTDDARNRLGELATAGSLLGAPRGAGITGLQLTDVEAYLPDDLLYKADIASMANSLELRAPLLDHELAELALGLPDHLRLDGSTGKVALRRAFAADLPVEILERGKAGFGVPVARWFRDELRDLAGDLLLGATARDRGQFRPSAVESILREHTEGGADHGARIWALIMLELWQQRYTESGTTPPA